MQKEGCVLRVTIELVPLGVESRKRVIGQAIIYNDASGDYYNGNYQFDLKQKSKKTWRSGRITGFKRRSKNCWHLLKQILNEGVE